tara:strand:+ start:4014 stop:5693 length:1680 start_codon:yes stop_codon:yes gene_type:complete
MKSIQNKSIGIILLSTISISYFFQVEKIVTFTSGILIILYILLYTDLSTKLRPENDWSIKLFQNINSLWLVIVLFIFTIFTQNSFLNFETITWDVASYLVASIEVGQGNIPMETQWESKGPVLFYLYYLFNLIANGNYIYFRLINDVLLFIISLFIFWSVYIDSNKDKAKGFFSSMFFILLTSKVWYVSEFSELYCLFFISLAYLLSTLLKNKISVNFIEGLLIGISSLINQGSVLFLIPFVIKNLKNKINLKNIISQSIGFIFPHLFFVLLYLSRDLFDVYYANYITIPLGYSEASLSTLYELRVWTREYFHYNHFLYFSILSLGIGYVLSNINNIKNAFLQPYFSGTILGIAIYFIGSHNYYHHLFYFLFFISLLFASIEDRKYKLVIFLFVIFSSVSIFINVFENSYNNLKSLDETYSNYPLLQLSDEIDSYFEDDYTIFALDYLFILHYLEKENYSYIVHPMNHFADFITDVLIDLNKIPKDNVNKLISEEPDVIICNTTMIINGVETRIDENYNCEITEYNDNYFKLDTTKYLYNENLFYFKDSTRKINVFIKK